MPKMDKTGPEGNGPATGRAYGHCKKRNEKECLQNLGKGMALRRKAGGGKGLGLRLQSDKTYTSIFEKPNK